MSVPGLGIGLALYTTLMNGVAYSPLDLFDSGEQGVWYDPSDFTTMFQDSAGTTPVTAVEQPVGLILDKSKGLALGADALNGAGSFASAGSWAVGAGWTIGSGVATAVNGANLALFGVLTTGKWYKITLEVTAHTSGTLYAGTISNLKTLPTGTGIKTAYFLADATSFYLAGLTSFNGTVDNVVVVELAGNHASQSTSASRPVLSARVNLLTYTEVFTNAAWVPGQIGAGVPTVVAADEISFPAIAASNYLSIVRQMFTSVATDYIGSVEVKAKAAGDVGKKICIYINDSSVVNFTFHTLTSSWTRISVTETTSATATCYFNIGVLGTAYGGQNQDACSVNIRNADLRPTNAGVNLPAYQRVGASTDYDTTGFPLYLSFDGVDDSLATGTISPGSVDKAQVFAGVRKLSDAAAGEYFGGSANGSLFLYTGGLTGDASRRTWNTDLSDTGANVSNAGAAVYASPDTRVVTGQYDYAGAGISTEITMRLNGVAQTLTYSGSTALTGNFANSVYYIGRRGGSTLPFNGHLYGLIVRFGSNLSAAEIASTEAWMNSKTGAY